MSIDLSLSRLSNLLPHLPLQYTRPTIHIAGTNGKGSVSALVSSILSHTSAQKTLSIGRFNSPHLVDVTDCILINEAPVAQDEYLAAQASVLHADAEHAKRTSSSRLTPFEVLTLTALQLLERAQVDVAVIEVGMGGQLDATNVIPSSCILVSALTSVALDHTGFLGTTIGAIAEQKAGIARQGRAFVLGPQAESSRKEVEEVVERTVRAAGGVVVPYVEVKEREWDCGSDGVKDEGFELGVGEKSGWKPPSGIPVEFAIPALSNARVNALLPLQGAHQIENLSTALGIIQSLVSPPPSASLPSSLDFKTLLSPQSIQNGIANVRWRGRLSWHLYTPSPSSPPSEPHRPPFPFPVLVDGAHNAASSQTLGSYISQILASHSTPTRKVNLTYILALSHSPGKSPLDTLKPLLAPATTLKELDKELDVNVSVACVPFSKPSGMPWVLCVPPSDLAAVVREAVGMSSTITSNGEENVCGLADTSLRIWTPSYSESEKAGATLGEGQRNVWLERALGWAAGVGEEGEQRLVVVAGSLYLVADFYRLLETN
ncbi:Mur ligase [Ephemerocybe angulata]|uniref:Mur ligase n=1 Tax=Ephemerocybe angulata TaxID=980116 RepID=A0A8H6IFF7_9AGAR|nr:Mur ligase [Tulosesus angulatus]